MVDIKFRCITGSLCFALLLGGCASGIGVELPPADEVLIPQIQQNGTKFFTFQRHYTEPAGDRTDVLLGREVELRQRAGYGGVDPEQMDYEIQQRLSEVFVSTGYCREGYFELYRDSTRDRFSLRGECREIATDADRARFDGDPIPL